VDAILARNAINRGVIYHGDCLDVMRAMPDQSVDLVFTSPPYEAARTYGIDFNLRGQEWVDWAAERFRECLRICRGIVAWNVEGQTRNFRWSATPALFMADLHRSGVKLRKPPIFKRVGIPGSGGPDWWRNDYEFIVCASQGKLPWSDNTATGHPPKYPPGGAPSHRKREGRVNRPATMIERATEPKAVAFLNGEMPAGAKLHTKNDGESMRVQCYTPPSKANPGNIVECSVGGGRMGSPLSHENEAPFPEKLAEAFVLSFCPPGGCVLDPFAGSGTTAAVAEKNGREWIAIDIRESQTELTARRISQA
jgi:DNA modification methylase